MFKQLNEIPGPQILRRIPEQQHLVPNDSKHPKSIESVLKLETVTNCAEVGCYVWTRLRESGAWYWDSGHGMRPPFYTPRLEC